MNIYIAAPFFNERQIETIQMIEDAIQEQLPTASVFSPRNSGPSLLQKERGGVNAGLAENIYNLNVIELQKAHVIIAVLFWQMPVGQRLVIQNVNGDVVTQLSIPDSGTVWEIGYVSALRIPPIRIGVTFSGERVNVMLRQCMDFNVSLDELKTLLEFMRGSESIQ